MVLFTSLNTALTGLNAAMAALQTTGHNIANASTPGYSRQRVDLQTARPLDMTRFHIGRGVSLERVARVVDETLEARLRDAASALNGLQIQAETLQHLEALTAGLSDGDIGAMMDRMFESLQDFANNPDDLSARTQVIANAQSLTETFNYMAGRIRDARVQLNSEVKVTVDEINRLTAEIAGINKQILSAENAAVNPDSANDLRDRRDLLVRQLSDLLEVTAVETSTGELNVLAGSAFIVFGAENFELTTTNSVQDGILIATPSIANGSATMTITDGKLRGLLDARDSLLTAARKDLDILANALAYEFNRVQSTGQGLERFSDLTSLYGMQDSTLALAIDGTVTQESTLDTITDGSFIGAADPTGRQIQILSGNNILETRTITAFDPATGTLFLDAPMSHPMAVGDKFQIKELPFQIVNGSFDVVLTNELTGVQESFQITIDLDRLPPADTTLADVVAQIDAIPGLSASLTTDNQIRIRSDSSDVRFSFANDTSGFLASVGLNAFFSGSHAGDIEVNPMLADNPTLLSGAQTNADGDNTNALAFSALRDLTVIQGSVTFEDFYQGFIGDLGVQAAEFTNRFENQSLLSQQLENQRQRVSGVNIDEEAVHMIQFQRAFQASARFIAVIDDLLNTLINGI